MDAPPLSAPARLRPGPVLNVILLALCFTLLNAFKPLHADDPTYFAYAAEFSRRPLNPYGFDFGSPYSSPANNLLVPPLLPYWWGCGLRLLGDDPFLWKLWLFPFALLLAASLSSLFRRFAPGVEAPLLWLTMFSPALLPAFNFMLEVPVLGLGLAAVVLAMRACDRSSWGLTLLAGLLGGLAAQTKYTALVSVAVIVLWCVERGQARRGLAAAGLALLVFASWEVFVACRQGQSHFLLHLGQRQGGTVTRCLHLALPLLTLVGGLSPAVVLLAAAALGWRRRWVAAVAAATALGFLGLALTPESWAVLRDPQTHRPWLTITNVVFGALGLSACAAGAAVVRRLLRRPAADPAGPPGLPAPRIERFLVGWLGLEVLGYFALSPFPAARRVVGVVLVFTLLAGRLASRTRREPSRRALVRWAAFAGALLGLFFFAVDWREARAAQEAAELVCRKWGAGPGNTAWYLSWCGFGFYAERAGLKPLVLNQEPPRPGDLIVAPDDPTLSRELLSHLGDRLEPIDAVTVTDGFPLGTMPCYYSGRTPLERREGPRITVRVYRVRAGADLPAAP